MRPALLLAVVAPFVLGGCLAKTAFDIATAPVRIASKGIDLATTSQSEADETRGREIRRREEQIGKLQREYDKQLRDCENGSERACEQARETYERIRQALPTVPAETGG
jgi:hypothetical protein